MPAGAIAGALLAGGRSTRMPSNKLLRQLPHTMARVIDAPIQAMRASGCAPCAWLAPEHPEPLPADFAFLADPGVGPLPALAQALHWAEAQGAEQLLVLAADLPLIQGHHLARLLRAAQQGDPSQAFCAAGPQGQPEPLCAVYPCAWGTAAANKVARGERAARALWGKAPTIVSIQDSSCESSHSGSESEAEVTVPVTVSGRGRVTIHPCFNLNDQEDWEQLQRWSKEGELP